MKRILAAFLACQVYGAIAAEPLGRLFFTPEQRAQLDAARKQRASRPVVEAAPAEEPPPPEIVSYTGMVRRSDGRSTVWLNNRPVHERAHEEGAPRAHVEQDGAARITLPQQQRSIRLKVGQTAELTSGRIAEGYARRAPEADAPPAAIAEPTLRLRRRHDPDRDPPAERTP